MTIETITRTDVEVYTVPTPEPETDGTARWEATTVVVVRVTCGTQAGLGWSYTAAAAAEVARTVLLPVLDGENPMDIPRLRHRMLAAIRNIGATGVGAAALSAIDIALWDLKAKLLDASIAELLGQARASVPVYGSGGFTSYTDTQTASELEHWLSLGIRDVKIKIGQNWGSDPRRDLDRVALARRVIGDDVGLLVDANGGYTTGQAVRIEAHLRDLDVTWFEEPVSSDDPQQLSVIRSKAAMDVAAGEYIWRVADARTLLDARAVDCLQLDVTRCGGYSAWLECAALAAGQGLQVSAHCAPHLAIQVAVATPNVRHLEYFIDHERTDGALFDGLPAVSGGALRPEPDTAGHGITVRPDAARYLPV